MESIIINHRAVMSQPYVGICSLLHRYERPGTAVESASELDELLFEVFKNVLAALYNLISYNILIKLYILWLGLKKLYFITAGHKNQHERTLS